MSVILAVLGACLVATSLVDMLWTTVAVPAGAGPVTGALSKSLWKGIRHLGLGSERHRILRLGGVLVVVSVFLTWMAMLVAGWSLVFSSSPGALVDAQTGASADIVSRVYFVAYTASTLGLGDYVPGDGLWQILTTVVSFSGLGVVTMAVTYLVPIVGAVTGRRTLALRISALGTDPAAIIRTAFEDGSWHAFERELERLGSDITRLGEQHLAYPVLHYFHDVDRPAAAAVMLAVLDETLTLLRFGLSPESRPSAVSLRSVRNAIATFLSTLESGHIDSAAEAPPVTPLDALRLPGLELVSEEELATGVQGLDGRRRTLLAFVEDDGWTWDAVVDQEDDGDDGVSEEHLDDAA